MNPDSMVLDYRKAGPGCRFVRFHKIYPGMIITDEMSKATCAVCRKHIKKYDLKYRNEFGEAPTFRPAMNGAFAEFRCPVCGVLNRHGWQSGHRVSHCECWENGYYLDCSIQ